MFTKKKVFAVSLCIICLLMSFVAFAAPSEEVPGYIEYIDKINEEAAIAEEEAEAARVGELSEEERLKMLLS